MVLSELALAYKKGYITLKKQLKKLYIILIGITTLWSCINTSQQPIQNLTPSPIPTIISVETVVADSDYLSGCRTKYPNSVKNQIDFKGIYPGVSTKEDLTRILGKPTKIIQVIPSEIEWLYDTDAFFLEKDLVVAIYTDGQVTLKDYLDLYGCPEIIFATDLNQHPAGNYKNLLFVYPQAGFTIAFNEITIQLTDIPIQVAYYTSGTLNDFLSQNEFLLYAIIAKPIFWHEVFK